MPFYLLHQPVIIVIAFFVVQWDAGITLKLLVVVLGSLAATLGLIELVVKRINVLRGVVRHQDPAPGNAINRNGVDILVAQTQEERGS